MREDVHFACPSFESRVAVFDELGIKEGREGVALEIAAVGRILDATFSDEIHVKVDDLVIEPVETSQRLHVLSGDADAEGVY